MEVSAGSAAGSGEPLMTEKLRGMLLALGSGAGGPLPGGTGRLPPMAPHDPDWLIPLGAILVALFAVACIMVYIITRWSSCKERHPNVSMFEHECLLASLFMVLLIIVSMASLYYYFCFRGGCYGATVTASAASGVGGRRAKLM